MSTVMRPRGPLPPRVYWTRRLLLVGIVSVFAGLVWWAMPGVGGSADAAGDPGGTGTTPAHHPSTEPTPPTGTDSTAGTATGHHQPAGARHPTQGAASETPPSTRGGPAPKHHRPAPPPTGPCDPSTLKLVVVAHSAPIGKGTTVGLRMSTGDGSTCSLGITPSLLETRITSGDVIVWQSGSCPDALPAKNVIVRPRPVVVYSYAWDGQINPDSCSATNRLAQPGGYWAEAALIGGEPRRTYFEVTPGR